MQAQVEAVRQKRKLERLALIKERYKRVVLLPRREMDAQLRAAFDEDFYFDLN